MPDKSFKGFSDGRGEREREKIQTWKIHLFMIITRTLKPHHCNTDRIPLRTELCPDRPPLPCLPPSIFFLPLSSSSLHLIYMLLTYTLFHPPLSQKCSVCVPSFSSPPSLFCYHFHPLQQPYSPFSQSIFLPLTNDPTLLKRTHPRKKKNRQSVSSVP